MNENGEDVFDKRLLSMVPGAVKFIVADVALQWVALACNIALFVVIGLFLQATLTRAWQSVCLRCRRRQLWCA